LEIRECSLFFQGDRHVPAMPTNARCHARARLGLTYPASLHRSRCQTGKILSPIPRRPGSGTGGNLVSGILSRPRGVSRAYGPKTPQRQPELLARAELAALFFVFANSRLQRIFNFAVTET
jgi:hypothetical protein